MAIGLLRTDGVPATGEDPRVMLKDIRVRSGLLCEVLVVISGLTSFIITVYCFDCDSWCRLYL